MSHAPSSSHATHALTPGDVATATWLIAAGRPHDVGGPLNTPIVPASNFTLATGGSGRAYTRDDATPAWEAFETIVGGLEGGHAVAFASGMAAAAAIFAQLPTGAHVVLPTDCYAGVVGLVQDGVASRGWRCTRLSARDTAAWRDAAQGADMLWVESPTNPLLEITDLPTLCAMPRKIGSLLVVDNTLATPLNQKPLAMGADAVMHSATKFMAGHSDAMAGVAVARDPATATRLRHFREIYGGVPGALEMFLATRGMRTLGLRVAAAQTNAMRVARHLTTLQDISIVRYPGLETDPDHERAATFMRGFGVIITFDVTGGAARADAICQSTRIIRHATSLGGVESTMERRGAVPGQHHLPPGLLRLSVGCEDIDDLIDDLTYAMKGTSRA